MKFAARISVASLFVATLCLSVAFLSAAPAQMTNARNVLTATGYTSYDPAPKGKDVQVAVVLKIQDGYHINAREVTFDYLIPPDLKTPLPAGFQAGDVVYPKGTLKTFTFSKKQPLNVYTGTVVLRFPMKILADAPLGPQHLPLKIRYQACSDEVCLPPVTKDVDTAFTVVSSANSAKPAHAEFFKQ